MPAGQAFFNPSRMDCGEIGMWRTRTPMAL
jgi:hypothetical protein